MSITAIVCAEDYYLSGQKNMAQPLLVLDTKTNDQLPRNFRTMHDKFDSSVSKAGLDRLHVSGSAAFSVSQLEKVKEHLKEKKIIVVDLRQESHGYVNGESVSWYADANAANRDKTYEQILDDEKNKLAKILSLKNKSVLEVADVKEKSEGVIRRSVPVAFTVQTAQSEEEVVRALGMDYKRFTVRDHTRPSDEQVDEYVKLIRDLTSDEWIHAHCRAGKGRTTTFIAIYDMMKNAKTVGLEDILKRQYDIGGSDLMNGDGEAFKQKDSDERAAFIKKFYQYAKENNDGFKTLWSQWLSGQ